MNAKLEAQARELAETKEELERLTAKLRWPHRNLGLENASHDADGVVVAILDTGVDREHGLLKHALVEGECLQEIGRAHV